jgi:lactoylglutathione lyase
VSEVRTLHVGLRVADLDRSLAFYFALGYEIVGSVPETPFGRLTMLKLPEDPFVSLELVHDPRKGPVDLGTGLNHLVVQVESMSAIIETLVARGVETEESAEHEGMFTSWLTDPDGYRIELVQWPPGHAEGMTSGDFSAD